jgi:NAD(P)-dependent dehydrogenase (short-subunit alcohol dehydrogenase family)
MKSDLTDWQRAWEINVLGPVELARTAVPHLRVSDDAAIVVVSSLAVRAINAGQGAYAATKGALTIAAQTLAREVPRPWCSSRRHAHGRSPGRRSTSTAAAGWPDPVARPTNSPDHSVANAAR